MALETQWTTLLALFRLCACASVCKHVCFCICVFASQIQLFIISSANTVWLFYLSPFFLLPISQFCLLFIMLRFAMFVRNRKLCSRNVTALVLSLCTATIAQEKVLATCDSTLWCLSLPCVLAVIA